MLFDICEHSPCAVVLKKQSTVETLVFDAEFVAMKQGIVTLRGLRYRLRIGIPISGPSHLYGDNMSVVHNTQTRVGTQKDKQLSLLSCSLRVSCNGRFPDWTYTQQRKCCRSNDKSPLWAKWKVLGQ